MIVHIKCLGCMRPLQLRAFSPEDIDKESHDWRAIDVFKIVICHHCSYTTVMGFDLRLRPISKDDVEYIKKHDLSRYVQAKKYIAEVQRNMWG